MKILFNTYYHAFQNPGGGEVVLLKTKEALTKKGITVDLFNPWESKISDYDIVHNFSTLNYREWDGYKSFCNKLVVTPVMWPDVSFKNVSKEFLKYKIKNLLGRDSSEVNFTSALNHVDKFFPTTKMESSRIQKRYFVSEEKMRVIYNGVDIPENESANNSFKSKYELNDYALFVGRISPQKNIEKIIQASMANDKLLVIVGAADQHDKEYEIYLKEKYPNSKSVKFIGALKSDSTLLSDAYYGASVLIVGSLFETCSLVGLEASIRGIPVLMTEIGGTKEVYGSFVKYVNPFSVDDISLKMSQNWSKEEKSKLQKYVSSTYSWDKIADNIIAEYSELLKR